MLYYHENTNLIESRTCVYAWYKPKTSREMTLVAYKKLRYFSITPRPQRLFMPPKTIKHITWHHSHDIMNGFMVHPFNGEA